MKLEHGTPREIEGESMRIIGRELEAMGIVLPAGCEAVVKRAIHTTADFDYARNLRFTPGAVEAGVAALRAGTALVTDTNMALSGVNRGACEQLGVERSRRAMEEAELILVVLDQSQPAREEDAALIRAAVERAPTIVVLNKQDLPCQLEWTEPLDLAASVPICAKTGAGLDGLAELVAQTFPRDPGSGYGELLTNQRQAEAAGRALESVRRAAESVARAGQALEQGVTPDALLTDVEEALSALGELTGQSVQDDVTDRIFQRFCVGK
mgnify:CR=1 FL=1